MKMNAHKRKHALFDRLEHLGFTSGESATLRRIEMTLHRWAERECGDGSNWSIQRDDATGKPFNVWHGSSARRKYAIADRESGALRRLSAIVAARNERNPGTPNHVIAYHQQDCRGCMVYLVSIAQLTDETGFIAPVEQYYTQGLAVCA